MNRKIGTNYTTILHGPRIELELSCNEYCVADMIYHLSRETGWCYASKEKLASFIGLSKQTVLEIIRRLTEAGLVEMHEDRHMLRTTARWYESVVVFREVLRGNESVRTVRGAGNGGKKTDVASGQETRPYSYSSQNNTEKSGFSETEKPLSLLREKLIELSINQVKYPNKEVLQLLEWFSDRCLKELGERPIMKHPEYFAILDARKYLSDEKIRDLLEDWLRFDSVPYKDKCSVTRALSPKKISSWKTSGEF